MIQIARDVLLQPVKAAVAGMLSKQVTSILGNALLEVSKDGIAVTGSDLLLQITARAPLVNGAATAITVSAKKLHDILRSLPADAEVVITPNGSKLLISAADSKFRLPTLPAQDFPLFPVDTDAVAEVVLPQAELKRILSLTSCAMPEKDVRHWLLGELLTLRDGRITFTAYSGSQIARASAALDQSTLPAEVIVPRKAVIELAGLLEDSTEPVRIRVYQKQVTFAFGSIEVASALLDGKFPDRQQPMPRSRRLSVERLPLLHALQQVELLLSPKFRGVRWVVEDGRLRLETAINSHSDADAEASIGIEYAGQAVDIGLNADFLIAALTSIPNDRIELAFEDSNNAVWISVPGVDFKYAVAGMRL